MEDQAVNPIMSAKSIVVAKNRSARGLESSTALDSILELFGAFM